MNSSMNSEVCNNQTAECISAICYNQTSQWVSTVWHSNIYAHAPTQGQLWDTVFISMLIPHNLRRTPLRSLAVSFTPLSKYYSLAVTNLKTPRTALCGTYKRSDCYVKKTTDGDWRVCSWPSHSFALGKDHCPLFVTGNRCITVNNASGSKCSRVLSVLEHSYLLWWCASFELRILFTSGLLTTKTLNKWRAVTRSYSNKVIFVYYTSSLTQLYYLLVNRKVAGSIPAGVGIFHWH